LDLLEKLQNDYDAAVAREIDLKNQVAMCITKLDRAEKLIDGLSGEKIRWGE
jgi:dynein heavy chain